MIILWILALTLVLLFGAVAFRGAPYVPTHRRELRRALTDLYPLSSQDVLVDVGSGDGVVLREAVQLGARGVGYEINPILVFLSRWLSRTNPNVEVRMCDFWLVDLPDEATIVYAFSVSRDMPKMARKLQAHVDRTGKLVMFMTYGSTLPGHESVGELGAHTLYCFTPLQSS